MAALTRGSCCQAPSARRALSLRGGARFRRAALHSCDVTPAARCDRARRPLWAVGVLAQPISRGGRASLEAVRASRHLGVDASLATGRHRRAGRAMITRPHRLLPRRRECSARTDTDSQTADLTTRHTPPAPHSPPARPASRAPSPSIDQQHFASPGARRSSPRRRSFPPGIGSCARTTSSLSSSRRLAFCWSGRRGPVVRYRRRRSARRSRCRRRRRSRRRGRRAAPSVIF